MQRYSFRQQRETLNTETAGETTCTCANHKGRAQSHNYMPRSRPGCGRSCQLPLQVYRCKFTAMFRTKRRKIERLDFIVAGAQKSGTTALHYFLSRHPDICMGDQQEIHFFDNDAMFIADVDYEQLHKHYPPLPPSMIAGDCTPSYLYHEPAMQRIWNYNPKIKLLILLRNPVERAFAHWNM